MVLKRIFLILILPMFAYAQWTDPRPRSVQLWHMAEGVIDSLTVSAFYADTLEAKETTLSEDVGGLIRLNGFTSSSNYGAGLFLITNTSYTPDGANVIDLNSGSNQLVRLTDPTVEDTLKLKNLPPLWQTVNLKQLSSSNTNGGGMFVYADSAYPESGVFAFDAGTQGKQWVRQEFLENPNTYNMLWSGALGNGSTNDRAKIVNLLAEADSFAVVQVPLGYSFLIDSTIVLTKPISFVGGGAIVEASQPTRHIFQVNTDDLTIDGLTITGSDGSPSSTASIFNVSTSKVIRRLKIANCTLKGKTNVVRVRPDGNNAGLRDALIENNNISQVTQGADIGVNGTSTSKHINVRFLYNDVQADSGTAAGSRMISLYNGYDCIIQGNRYRGGGFSVEAFTGTGLAVLENDTTGWNFSTKIIDNNFDAPISGGEIIENNIIDGDSLLTGKTIYPSATYAIEPNPFSVIKNNKIRNFSTIGGVVINNAGLQIEGNEFKNITSTTYAAIYFGSTYNQATYPLNRGHQQRVTIKNNYFYNCGRGIFNTINTGANTYTSADFEISENYFFRTIFEAIYLRYCERFRVFDNKIIDAYNDSTLTSATSRAIFASNADNLYFKNNFIMNIDPSKGAAYAIVAATSIDSIKFESNEIFNMLNASPISITATTYHHWQNTVDMVLQKGSRTYTNKIEGDSVKVASGGWVSLFDEVVSDSIDITIDGKTIRVGGRVIP